MGEHGARVIGKQDYQTPVELFNACGARFGEHHVDLAAAAENSMCGDDHFGPGSIIGEDSLATSWTDDCAEENPRGWLNPPFARMAPWIAKCIENVGKMKATVLCLASIETDWFRAAIKHADVYFLTPRVRFVGAPAQFNRNLMILDFNGERRRRPPCVWDWKTNEITEFAP
jgi:hypothetical protein